MRLLIVAQETNEDGDDESNEENVIIRCIVL
jgi:hypothetical protein